MLAYIIGIIIIVYISGDAIIYYVHSSLLQYDGGRTTADFVKFLNEKAGTQRLPGGKLSDQVSYMYMYEYMHRL